MEATRAPAVSRAPGMPASPVSKPSTFGTFTPSAFYSLPQDNELGNNGRKYSMSPKEERKSFDRFSPTFADIDGILDDADLNTPTASALLLRKLSQSMTQEALNSMLLFASDLIDARFVSQSRLDDSSFQTAVARFSTVDGALEVRTRLNGKANASNDAAMIVEVIKGPAATVDTQHRVSDSSSGRHWSTSASSQGSSGGANKSSRFSSTFQSMDRGSPTKASRAPGTLDLASLPNGPQLPSAFSPTSPTKQLDRRITGKSMISDDAPDEETRELLQNPLAFAEGGRQRQRSLHMPISQISKLTLNTNNEYSLNGTTVVSPSASTFSPNRGSHQPLQSPTSEFSPGFGMSPLSPGVGFPGSPQAYQRFPPANPADQNPPCNTLYVGNLPMDTAEEELKDLFSKQRGYKRLCFRTKHNGPMCFVEFEDVSFATKALHELYGCMLSNSVRSGIRLSFSKNPLGVRTGQSSTNGTGYGGFAAANGPPPGLSMPPGMGNGAPPSDGPQGLSNGVYYTQGSPPRGAFANNNAFQGQGVPHFYGGGARNNFSPIGNALPDLTMRR